MNLRVPPVLQLIICMLLMWSISKISIVKHFDFPYQKQTSRLFFAIGIAIGLIALYAFRKARTTVENLREIPCI